MTGLPCPNCGSELAFIEQYGRHYCYVCGQYAPEGFGDQGAKICPTCGGILSYVTTYNRYYCYRDNAYPASDAVLKSMQDTASQSPTEETPIEAPAVASEPPKAEEGTETTAETPAESTQESEVIVEEEIPPEQPAPVRERPPLVRVKIFQAKKTALMDLCTAYDLDPTGTKEELRERLLSYLDTLEAQAQPEEVPEDAEVQEEPVLTEETSATESVSAALSGEAAEVQPAVEEAPREELASTSTATPTVVETEPQAHTEVETVPGAAVVVTPEAEATLDQAPVVEKARVAHPCPTCGRELTFIGLYRRWFCYHCGAYAPVSKSKFACPNCGAALRWIEQYERWWCDSCRRYAPADLPKPQRAIAAAAGETSSTHVTSYAATTIVHRHRSPGNGIGLMGFGVVLFLLYEVLVDLPRVLSFSTGIIVSPDLAFGLRFFAFVFVAIGAIMGLSALRDRR